MKIQYILLSLLLVTVTHARAETDDPTEPLKKYDIEIIIFEDAHARYINSESWNRGTLKEDTSSDNKSASFEPLKPGILRKEYNRINNSSEFNVLLYTAWRQTGLKKDEAFEIDINKLDNAHRNRSKNTITGNIKVVLARYLHFYSQLEYKRKENIDSTTESNKGVSLEQSADTGTTTGIVSYPVNSHRRMRSKELHYIDHPLLGILVQINPVESKPAEVKPAGQESGELSNPNR